MHLKSETVCTVFFVNIVLGRYSLDEYLVFETLPYCPVSTIITMKLVRLSENQVFAHLCSVYMNTTTMKLESSWGTNRQSVKSQLCISWKETLSVISLLTVLSFASRCHWVHSVDWHSASCPFFKILDLLESQNDWNYHGSDSWAPDGCVLCIGEGCQASPSSGERNVCMKDLHYCPKDRWFIIHL